MKKESFIEILKSCTPEDINEIIKEKGKEPKLTKAIIFIK